MYNSTKDNKYPRKMASLARFELATYGLGGRRSILLSYESAPQKVVYHGTSG